MKHLKMHDLKMQDQMSPHENAGPENEGPSTIAASLCSYTVISLCDTVISVHSVLRVSLRNCRLITSFYCFTPLVLHFHAPSFGPSFSGPAFYCLSKFHVKIYKKS